jgi:hypothetical protein
MPRDELTPMASAFGLAVCAWGVIGGGVLSGVAMLFGVLRAYFTFFSTVPIGGVWIGTAALIVATLRRPAFAGAAAAALSLGIVHVSAVGADRKSKGVYGRTKAAGEAAV